MSESGEDGRAVDPKTLARNLWVLQLCEVERLLRELRMSSTLTREESRRVVVIELDVQIFTDDFLKREVG